MNENKLGVIGCGYVGLPLAVLAADYFEVYGFDLDASRVAELNSCFDRTGEISSRELDNASCRLTFGFDEVGLRDCSAIFVAVPTPVIDGLPDLRFCERACEAIGRTISKGALVIFESTVFPGATERHLVPIIENISGLIAGQDFYVSFSPERANPADAEHKLVSTPKVVSGLTKECLARATSLYSRLIRAPLAAADSIMEAELSKLLENTQRDVNIALVNEFSIYCRKENINFNSVLRLARTKWNFADFRPGLVGGHCIPVDPYYFIESAKNLGVKPCLTMAARMVNEEQAALFYDEVNSAIENKAINSSSASVLIVGLSFKPNCGDARNSKMMELYRNVLARSDACVRAWDPLVVAAEGSLPKQSPIMTSLKGIGTFDIIVIGVNHSQIDISDIEIAMSDECWIFDLTGQFESIKENEKCVRFWRL